MRRNQEKIEYDESMVRMSYHRDIVCIFVDLKEKFKEVYQTDVSYFYENGRVIFEFAPIGKPDRRLTLPCLIIQDLSIKYEKGEDTASDSYDFFNYDPSRNSVNVVMSISHGKFSFSKFCTKLNIFLVLYQGLEIEKFKITLENLEAFLKGID